MFDAGNIAVGIAAGAAVALVACFFTLRALPRGRLLVAFGLAFSYAAVFCSIGAYVGAMA